MKQHLKALFLLTNVKELLALYSVGHPVDRDEEYTVCILVQKCTVYISIYVKVRSERYFV